MRPLPLLLALVSAIAVLLALVEPPVHGQVYRSGVDLVVVAATVVDADGRLVPGLTQSDFHVFDDGVEQRILQFNAERVPVSLGLAIDVSDSMIGARMAAARKAIDRFVLSLLDEGDEAFLMVFNHAPSVKTSWTRPRSLSGRLDRVTPSGGTAIFDAVVKAAAMFDTRRFQRCGLVVISDGNDTSSDASLQDTLRRINQTDASVYAIALDAPGGAAINRPFSPEALNDLDGTDRRVHRSDPRSLGADGGSRADCQRTEPPVHHRLRAAAQAGRPVPRHPRQGRRLEADGPVPTRVHPPQGEAGRPWEVASWREAAPGG